MYLIKEWNDKIVKYTLKDAVMGWVKKAEGRWNGICWTKYWLQINCSTQAFCFFLLKMIKNKIYNNNNNKEIE